MKTDELSLDARLHFDNARYAVLGEGYNDSGIGTYSERSLHRILKLFIEPREQFHEVKYSGSIADIKNEEGIFEIQTRALAGLKRKLFKFLPECRVTVVYPIPYEKRIYRIDRDSGQLSPPRKSPKRSGIFDAVYELYNLREYLAVENLSVKLVFVNVDEYRYNGGRVMGRERRSVRTERIPTSLHRIVDLATPEDYRIFIPDGLSGEFCAADFNRAVGKSFRYGYSAIQILKAVGLVSEGERIGRKVIYKLK